MKNATATRSEPRAPSVENGPERTLVAAILHRAQWDLHSNWPEGAKSERDGERIRLEVRTWILSSERGFSTETGVTFKSCCDVLGLNAALVRDRMLNNKPLKMIVREIEEDEDEQEGCAEHE